MKTKDNYYRVILETVWNYDDELLNSMTDEDCEAEYEVITDSSNWC